MGRLFGFNDRHPPAHECVQALAVQIVGKTKVRPGGSCIHLAVIPRVHPIQFNDTPWSNPYQRRLAVLRQIFVSTCGKMPSASTRYSIGAEEKEAELQNPAENQKDES